MLLIKFFVLFVYTKKAEISVNVSLWNHCCGHFLSSIAFNAERLKRLIFNDKGTTFYLHIDYFL